MDWTSAQAALNKIQVGTDINTKRSTYRQIISKNENEFIVRVSKKDNIRVTEDMLKSCFLALSQSSGYCRKHFEACYSQQCKNKPCYVHVIGQIFVKAGLAYQDPDRHRYFLSK